MDTGEQNVTNAFRLLVRSGRARFAGWQVSGFGGVTNAFRLLVRSGPRMLSEETVLMGIKSQTPFGCWSDQDVWRKATEVEERLRQSQTPFGCWSDQDTRNMQS